MADFLSCKDEEETKSSIKVHGSKGSKLCAHQLKVGGGSVAVTRPSPILTGVMNAGVFHGWQVRSQPSGKSSEPEGH